MQRLVGRHDFRQIPSDRFDRHDPSTSGDAVIPARLQQSADSAGRLIENRATAQTTNDPVTADAQATFTATRTGDSQTHRVVANIVIRRARQPPHKPEAHPSQHRMSCRILLGEPDTRMADLGGYNDRRKVGQGVKLAIARPRRY
jgi:hypothetical protein